MKKYIGLVSVILLASCSAPKYTYYFDHYDYASKKAHAVAAQPIEPNQPLATIDENTLVASADDKLVYLDETATPSVHSQEEVAEKITTLSKEEKRELRREIKKYIKEAKKSPSAEVGNSTQALENDVKLAAIFGAAGIVLLIIGGDVLYVLGAIALLVGLYFLIRWLIQQ